jgi:hypothetical protein
LFIATLFDADLLAGFFVWLILCVGVCTGIESLFDKNAVQYKEPRVYELVNANDSNYVTVTGGEYSKVAVCYIDSENKYQTYSITGKEVYHDDGPSRIETQYYKWGFLTGSKTKVFLNE